MVGVRATHPTSNRVKPLKYPTLLCPVVVYAIKREEVLLLIVILMKHYVIPSMFPGIR